MSCTPNYIFATCLFTLATSAFASDKKNQYQWKKRIVECSANLFEAQSKELSDHKEQTKDLKLIALSNKSLQNKCNLIGLDGGIKKSSSQIFSMEELEKTINSMIMRKIEIKSKKSK